MGDINRVAERSVESETPIPACPQRDEIIIEWRESVVIFADEVKRLAACTGGNREGFLDQFQITDQARQHCEDVHTALRLHRVEHEC